MTQHQFKASRINLQEVYGAGKDGLKKPRREVLEEVLGQDLTEMYIQGVSTRKVKAITEELCGHAFSASAISAVNKTLDESLDRFAKRPLEETYPSWCWMPAMGKSGKTG
jgi:hypothetical protein